MVELHTFAESSLSITGEEHTLIELAEILRESGRAEGILGDLAYQIDYTFDIGNIRSADLG